MEDYQKFIEAKRHRASDHGIKPVLSVHIFFQIRITVAFRSFWLIAGTA